MNIMKLRLTLIALAAAALAACGGGGSNSGTPASLTPAATAPGTTTTSSAKGAVKLTFTYSSAPSSTHATAGRAHVAGTRRVPQYLSNKTSGFQITITAGTQSTVYDIDLNYNNSVMCTNNGNNQYACTLTLPTLAATETIAILALDQEPTGTVDPATGIATVTTGTTTVPGPFPSGTAVLATGSTTVTLTPGAITNVAISLNPVIGAWYDCGLYANSNAEGYDYNGRRLVLTGNVASSGTLAPIPVDYDGGYPIAVAPTAGAALVGQPFSDVNGTAQPITAVSSFSHVTVAAQNPQGAASPPYPPVGTFIANVAFPDSSYDSLNEDGLFLGFKYDGFASPSGNAGTIVVANNLTATPPLFSGTPPYVRPGCCYPYGSTSPSTTNYSSTMTYTLAPLFATAASATITHGTTMAVTGYDPGATNSMGVNDCLDAYGNDLGYETPAGSITNGVQPFTFTAGSTPGTCTFVLNDGDTGIQSNPVTVTIQ
jgi:hypothetical protein